jgi:hypothetical protein
MQLAILLAQSGRSATSDPVVVGLVLVFLAFNIWCIYRCIRGGHWVMLILGFLLCGLFWWIGAFMSPNHKRVKRTYRYHV